MVSQVALFLLTGHSSVSCIDTSYSPSNSCRRLHTTTFSRLMILQQHLFLHVWSWQFVCELHLFLSKTVIWATNVVSPSSTREELLLFLFTTSSVKSETDTGRHIASLTLKILKNLMRVSSASTELNVNVEIIKKKERYKTKCGLLKYFCFVFVFWQHCTYQVKSAGVTAWSSHKFPYSHKQTSADTLYNTSYPETVKINFQREKKNLLKRKKPRQMLRLPKKLTNYLIL